MCMKRAFEVNVVKSEVVAAPLPMQDHWLPLSNLDLLLPPSDVSVFLCYENHEMSSGEIVDVLKKALTQTLISYYPFAGELVKNRANEPELLCNNRGVDFHEAFANAELRDVDFYNLYESVAGKLVPLRKRGVLTVQVTQLNRGGLVVACTFAHQAADAYSINMFLVSWAEMAQSKPLSQPPNFRRSLLLPRRSGCYDHSLDDMYVAISSLPPPSLEDHPQNEFSLSRIYYIESDRVNELQSLVNKEATNYRTKLEAFCAYLWKIILPEGVFVGDRSSRLGIVVDGRKRLIDGEDENGENMMASYFGNVLSVAFRENKIQDLKQNSLHWVANEVHEFLYDALRKEHFLELIDWVEEHRPEPIMSRICACVSTEEEPAVMVSSGQQFPMRKIDFGWGLPVFWSYHLFHCESGYVMPMLSPKENGDWIVYMRLLKGQFELIDGNAARVFNPLTSDYLFSSP